MQLKKNWVYMASPDDLSNVKSLSIFKRLTYIREAKTWEILPGNKPYQ
jgi:hypothetical protein